MLEPSLRTCKPAYSEPVPKLGNMEGCIRRKNTWVCMAGFALTVICVTAADLLVVIGMTERRLTTGIKSRIRQV